MGQGTTFRLCLPCFRDGSEDADYNAKQPPVRDLLMAEIGETVLVAKDERGVRTLIVEELAELRQRIGKSLITPSASRAAPLEPAQLMIGTD